MKKLVTMREALASSRYFGDYLKGESWGAWRVLLISMMGETLTPDERVIFESLTGRETPPPEAAREFWGVISRRGGKSRAMAVAGAYLAACCDHRAVLAPGERGVLPILAASTKQAQQFFNFVSGIFASVPAFVGLVNDATADTLRLKTGVDITITTASWRTVRSITAISAIADEIAFWRSDETVNPDQEILAALKPALLTTGGLLIAISSPYARRGELWATYRRHYGPGGDPCKLVAQAASLTMNPSLPQEEIDLAYEEDPARASAEYGGQFRTDVEQFISRETIDRCTAPGLVERPPIPGVIYYGFVDPSGGSSDAMTLAVAHRENDVAVLDLVREVRPPFSPEATVAAFAADLKRYRLARVTGDRYGGEFVREPFRRHGITYNLADRPRSDLYRDCLPLLNSGRADLLDLPQIAAQFVGLERRTGRSGRDSIDHGPASHDDVANAVAGALVGAVDQAAEYDTTKLISHYSVNWPGGRARGFNPDRLSPAQAVRLGFCSEERAKQEGWI